MLSLLSLLSVPQLLVRDLETAVVRALRKRAAATGVSVEEAHRQVLREALLGNVPSPQKDFLAYLQSMPESDIEFTREPATDRPVDL